MSTELTEPLQPLLPDPFPPRHRRWPRVLVAAAAFVVAVGIAGGLTSHPAQKPAAHSTAAPAVTASTPVISASAPASPQPAASAPAAPAAAAPDYAAAVNAWNSGQGGADFQAVRADLSQIQADGQNYDLAAVEADGPQFTADAEAAMKDPIPLDKQGRTDYVLAMGSYSFAGIEASQGSISQAAHDMQIGNEYLQKTTADLKRLTGS